MKRLIKLVILVAAAGMVIWWLREKSVPIPTSTAGPVEPFRAPTAAAPDQPDDLTTIKGIGPVFAAKLEAAGFSTFAEVAAADAAALAAAAGVGEERARGWIRQAGKQ